MSNIDHGVPMFKLARILTLIVAFGLPFFGYAQEGQTSAVAGHNVVIVSDIDDTIRNTYSRARLDSKYEYLGYASSAYRQLLARQTMMGMKELYNTVISTQSASIYYVTNFHLSQTKLFGESIDYKPIGDDFIRQAGFPKGTIYRPESGADRTGFKKRAIQEIIA